MMNAMKWTRKSHLPLALMLLVFIAPFLVSVWTLQQADELNNNAKGQWLGESIRVAATADNTWQVLWNDKTCAPDCRELNQRLFKLKLALGKHQTQLTLTPAPSALHNQTAELFIADRQGLVLLGYGADQNGLYKLFKDLKVLMKHGGA